MTKRWWATLPRFSNTPPMRDWNSGMSPDTILFDALIPALEEVGARFERGDFFVPGDARRRVKRCPVHSMCCVRCSHRPARRA